MRLLNTGGPFVMSTGQTVPQGEAVDVPDEMVALLPRAFVPADQPGRSPRRRRRTAEPSDDEA